MNIEELGELFDKHTKEYLHFERIESPLHGCPDICAFLVLSNLVPEHVAKHRDIISASEHDEFYLAIEPRQVLDTITEDIVITLIRCGLRYSPDDGFKMFS